MSVILVNKATEERSDFIQRKRRESAGLQLLHMKAILRAAAGYNTAGGLGALSPEMTNSQAQHVKTILRLLADLSPVNGITVS